MSDKTLGQILNELYKKAALKKPYGYSMTQWARDVYDINNQAMSSYMNDVRKPTGENLEKFLDVHGKEFYSWMGQQVPDDWDPIKRAVWRRWKELSPEAREKIAELVEAELRKQPRMA